MSDSIPTEMNAVEIAEPGGPEVLVPCVRPVPKPAKGEVLIRVSAAGVNRPDVIQRLGMYASPRGASDLPGLEVAGIVVAAGEDVPADVVGQRVTALVAGGGYAEYCAAPYPQCLPIPTGLSETEAAGLPETFFTVWSTVFDRGRLKEGERFLVHGGSSGIGTTAIQLAKAFGATVYTTVGNEEKAAACRALGADRVINYNEEDYVAVLKKETGKVGVDVILDMVGGDYLPRNLKVLAVDGRHVSIAFLRGPTVEVNFMMMMLKRQTITGATLRPQSIGAKAAIAEALGEKVWPLIAEGRIRPIVHKTFPLAEAADAHRLMESSAHIGKIVLTV